MVQRPTVDNPMDAAQFLSFADLSAIRESKASDPTTVKVCHIHECKVSCNSQNYLECITNM